VSRPLLWIWCLLLALPPAAVGQARASVLSADDRLRLSEARRLADEVGERVWPGWSKTSFPILLVTDTVEFLIGHPRPDESFARLGYDSLLASDIWSRPRRFPPTLLATFPAVGGLATVVIGSAERTNKAATAWVLTLLHEHFHQWQYGQPNYYANVAQLDLSGGDSTGQWMLDYPFPYDSKPVQESLAALGVAVGKALDAPPGRERGRMQAVVRARERLERSLTPADYRYLEFQLWQEGVARYIEYAAARAAAEKGAAAALRGLKDFQPYGHVATGMLEQQRQDLARLDLSGDRRVAFYPLGAAIARLLDRTRPSWKATYASHPFALATLLRAD
jgi:hypothetical protein